MEKNAFETSIDIYNQYDFTTETDFMNNRLFATFTQQDLIEGLINELSSTYSIMYKKMFVLFIKSTNEYVITYNVEQGNVNTIPENTILVHRKKESNTRKRKLIRANRASNISCSLQSLIRSHYSP